jgi:methanogenic corrinoid protein MtbC1
MYTEADVERLRLLRDAVSNGHPIGRIALLEDGALRELAAARPPRAKADSAAGVAADAADAIVEALARFDVAAVEARLARAAGLTKPPALLRDVIAPALATVGDGWQAGRLSVAHEHLFSSLVRSLLGSLMHLHARVDVPDRLLFATPSGERHEFGALGAALMAASGGLGAVYLGPDVPAADLIEMASVVDADVIALGVTGSEGGPLAREIERIAGSLSRDVELWVGGRAAAGIAAAIHPRVLAIPDYDSLERELARLGARF